MRDAADDAEPSPPAEASPFVFLRDVDCAALARPHLTADRDVLALHGIAHLFDTHVRPYLPPRAASPGAAGEPARLKLVFRQDSAGKIASSRKPDEPREMEPTYKDYLPDITFPPDLAPSTNLEYLAFHPNPNLPPTIAPVDDAFLRAFRLEPGKISPEEFDGSILGVAPPTAGAPKPEKKPAPPPTVPTGTLKIKLTKLGSSTPGTPSSYVASPVSKPAAGNVAPEYNPGTPTGGTTIRLTVGDRSKLAKK